MEHLVEDHEINPGNLLRALERNARNMFLEDGRLIDITPLAKKVSEVSCSVDFTNNLFSEIYPYAEDVNKNILWEDRISDLLREFKKHAAFTVNSGQLDFDVKIKTVVKKEHSYDEVETYKHSKEIDRVIPVYCMWMPNEKGTLGLLFGLRKA